MWHNELSTFLEWISKVILFMGTNTKLYGLNFYLFDLIVKTFFFSSFNKDGEFYSKVILGL